MPFPSLVCAIVETTINQLLKLDASTDKRITPLLNKALKLTLQEFKQPLFFFFSSNRVEILSDFEGNLDVELTLSVNALGQLQDNNVITQLIKSEQLVIVGDIKLLQQFADLLTNLDIDWAEHLSHYTGDVVAHHSAEAANNIASKFSRIRKTTKKQLSEYLTQELMLAPSKLEFIHFGDQISELNQRLIALEVRIAQLR
jgi:ubiquinone biosynthesis accessory factor UbiJ